MKNWNLLFGLDQVVVLLYVIVTTGILAMERTERTRGKEIAIAIAIICVTETRGTNGSSEDHLVVIMVTEIGTAIEREQLNGMIVIINRNVIRIVVANEDSVMIAGEHTATIVTMRMNQNGLVLDRHRNMIPLN